MNHVDNKQGFTIIELMLAMTFVSFLLIGIALTVIQIGAVYNKGTTLKEINQTSRELNDELRRNITASGKLDYGNDYVLSPASASSEQNAAGGRLCLGTYSYIWNYARSLASNSADVTKYASGSKDIQFIKVPDSNKIYCNKSGLSGTDVLVVKEVSDADEATAVELLKSGDRDLGIHKFTLNDPPASAKNAITGQQVYNIAYTIGTSRVSAMNSDQSACLDASLPNADPLYCNVRQFGLVVRTGK
jgi:type II secretory pathway pseudopilin PulG